MKPLLPFVPTDEEIVEKMVKLSGVKSGMLSVDLGAGDGRVVIAMAKAGAKASGYEIQPKYARRAKVNIVKEGLEGQAEVLETDFWKQDLSKFDIVTIYGMAELMDILAKKLNQELKRGTVVISNGFPLPGWELSKKEGFLYVYVKA